MPNTLRPIELLELEAELHDLVADLIVDLDEATERLKADLADWRKTFPSAMTSLGKGDARG